MASGTPPITVTQPTTGTIITLLPTTTKSTAPGIASIRAGDALTVTLRP